MTDPHDGDAASPYVLEAQVGFKLRLAYQKHAELFAVALPDLTPTQFSVLCKLRELGSISQNELGRQVAMDAATVKGVIDRLKTRDLVKTAPSKTDLRRLDVSLTPAGSVLIETVIPKANAISRSTLRHLNRKEEAMLLGLLDKLIE